MRDAFDAAVGVVEHEIRRDEAVLRVELGELAEALVFRGERGTVEALLGKPELVRGETQGGNPFQPFRVGEVAEKNFHADGELRHCVYPSLCRSTAATLRMASAIWAQSFSLSCGGMSMWTDLPSHSMVRGQSSAL